MSYFKHFELPVNKVQDYPLVFDALIPPECTLFQDVRRYQSLTAHLDVRIINIDGKIAIEQGVVPVPISKISSAERKEFIEYLRLRITRGDNIGSSWVFFRSENRKKPLIAMGANLVYRDSTIGHARAVHLLTELKKIGVKTGIAIQIIKSVIVIALIAGGGYFVYDRFIRGKEFSFGKNFDVGKNCISAKSNEMQFYKTVFPDIYEWLYSKVVDEQVIAKVLLNPDYVKDILACMDKSFYRDSGVDGGGNNNDSNNSQNEKENSEHYKTNSDNYRGIRLALFVYFNYNQNVKDSVEKYRHKLDTTEFGRLAKIYSCAESGYSSNIFYFKVGELDIQYPQINDYLTDNMVSYNDYTRLRDTEGFSEMLKKDDINFRLKNFLSDVYTFTPLKIENPIENIEWYLLTKALSNGKNPSEKINGENPSEENLSGENSSGKINFAAFFKRNESTMIPRDISTQLIRQSGELMRQSTEIAAGDGIMHSGGIMKQQSDIFTWYKIDEEQKRILNLKEHSTICFTDKIGQNFKLDVIEKKITELALEKIEGSFPVTVYRELLMEDSKGKYGIQCYDPVISLVLSNLISKSSFESQNKVTLKRDPIQINTSLIQLSKDDSTSTQAVNISPGKTGIVNLFKNVDHFRGRLANGQDVKFEKADINLFNPFSFTVYDDSITFSYKHEISGMECSVNKKILKITKSDDGGHQIIEIN